MTSARENTHKRDKGNALWTLKRPKLVLSAFYATDFSQTLQGFRIKKNNNQKQKQEKVLQHALISPAFRFAVKAIQPRAQCEDSDCLILKLS